MLKKSGLFYFIAVGMVIILSACSGFPPAVFQPQKSAVAAERTSNVPSTGQTVKYHMNINDDVFKPLDLIVPVGATVVWTNQSDRPHTVTADDGSFDSGSLKKGATYERAFSQAGTYVFHSGQDVSANGKKMAGAIIVVSDLAQASGPSGSGTAADAANAPFVVTGVKREFYIAAVEVEWDYAPTGKNQITGQDFDDAANVFVQNGPNRIGRVYTKAVYREFTDATFNTQKPIRPEWQHLGIMGPTIHAEVGDEIVIHFKNKTTIPTSMHPHGVFYKKDSEGAPYNDGTSGADKEDDGVLPGGTHTYIWDVPDRAGPGPMDPKSIMWMYHSHVDEPGDQNAGLMGAIIVSAKGNAKPDGTPKDVDREFVVTFSVLDENISSYLQHNIDTKTGDPKSVDPNDPEFNESNLMHSINGYVFGNLPGLAMKKGERVRWYVMGMGTEVDLHTPHWHGNTILYMGSRMDVIDLLPASMKVVDMVPDNPGVWLLHCHVNDHILAGMLATYKVEP